eukprot:g9414.t1
MAALLAGDLERLDDKLELIEAENAQASELDQISARIEGTQSLIRSFAAVLGQGHGGVGEHLGEGVAAELESEFETLFLSDLLEELAAQADEGGGRGVDEKGGEGIIVGGGGRGGGGTGGERPQGTTG